MITTLNAYTNGFHGWESTTGFCKPRRVRWVYGQQDFDGVTLFEDSWMFHPHAQNVKSKYRLGWLVEPRALRPENYYRALQARDQFDYILTYDAMLLGAYPEKFILCPRMGLHILPGDWGMRTKWRDVAIITTTKNWTEGHKLRHAVVERFGGRVDVFGRTEFADKITSLSKYRYSIVIESERTDHLFTDHLLDVIALGCIPLYWGAPNIGQYLDETGILPWRDLDELGRLLDTCDAARYDAMLPAARRNYDRLDEYALAEDWIAARFLEKLL